MKKDNFFLDYYSNLNSLALEINESKLKKISTQLISSFNKSGQIIVVGNGGSAAIASHVSIDLVKSVGIRSMTFNESSLLTCFSNDYGYENWVVEALKVHARKEDTIILISSSGESSNILRGAHFAKEQNINLITFSGFKKNNSLSNLGRVNIWVNSCNYNYVEITHHNALLAIVDWTRINLKT